MLTKRTNRLRILVSRIRLILDAEQVVVARAVDFEPDVGAAPTCAHDFFYPLNLRGRDHWRGVQANRQNHERTFAEKASEGLAASQALRKTAHHTPKSWRKNKNDLGRGRLLTAADAI